MLGTNWLKQFAGKTLERLGVVPRTVYKRVPGGISRRSFDAAKRDRLTDDWQTNNININSILRMQLPQLVARSRNMARNDDYFKQFLLRIKNNVVGSSGIRMQSKVLRADGTPDTSVNSIVEEAWLDWGLAENCSVTGRMTWRTIQALAIRTVMVDGECFIRHVLDDSLYGYKLQFIPTDWFDITYNDDTPGKNRIIMSVELDSYGKPVAYYLTPPRNDFFAGVPDSFKPASVRRDDRMRVSAEDILHLFIAEEVGQVRGIPWPVSAMTRLRMMGAYEDAVVVNQRVAASKMGFLQAPDTVDDGTVKDEEDKNDFDPFLDQEDEVQAGMLKRLPPGYTFAEFNPQDPKIGFGEFLKGVLRGVAAGFGISYNSLASDAESVSFGTLRQMVVDDRDFYKEMQTFLAEYLCQAVFKKWTLLNADTEQLPLPISKLRKVLKAIWRGRGWQWIDPKNDAQAAEIKINLGITTRTQLAEEQGQDYEELIEQLAQEQKLAEKHGVNIYGSKQPNIDESDGSGAKQSNSGKAVSQKS